MDSRDRDLPDGPDGSALRLRNAIQAVVINSGSRDELEAAARALVVELRNDKHPPEQVLLRIKDVLAQAGLRPGHTLAADGSEVMGEATLYREVVSSSIVYYFDGE
jgi:hypothetical protein